ncbi:MAG: hypothetical protein MI924_20845 [Chloroflexales bacterium]|nr:hypothetical protein [Chloroflexales bacterium]
MSTPSFKGTTDQQLLAAEVFRLMTTQGAMFAEDAPIRQTLSNLADFLAVQQQRDVAAVSTEIDAALRQNHEIFIREEQEGEVVYVTARIGSYVSREEDTRHTFKVRLYEPEQPLPVDDISVVVSTSRPALTTVEPVFISDYWQRQAGLLPPDSDVDEDALKVAQPAVPLDGDGKSPVPSVPIEKAVTPPPVETAASVKAPPAQPVVPDVVPDEVMATPSSVQPVEVPPEIKPTPPPVFTPATVFTLSDGTSIDLSQPAADLVETHGAALESLLLASLEQDPLRRVVSFGRYLYPEANLVSLGKNDMRRIRDYIIEVGEPLLDTSIIADLYYHNPRQTDYEGFRFSLNYRLSREKDFDFVGIEGARLWSTRGLPTIGSKRVKASEMGQITSYLNEGFDDSLEQQNAEEITQNGLVTRVLTFFEWEYGMLPFDASLSALLPSPLLAEQRSAVLRIESPQHYTVYLVEMRFPTGNRGGWLQGLEEFFHEHLVPGAYITIGRTEEPNVFTITYDEAAVAEDRLLTLDEKKNKLSFSNKSYYCVVDDNKVINQQKFGKLKNLKSLTMSDRRKADVVLAHVFETFGEHMGRRDEPHYWISLDDLVIAYNVLRPASRSFVQSLLESNDEYSPDPSTPETYYYKPVPELVDEDEEEDEGILLADDYDENE